MLRMRCFANHNFCCFNKKKRNKDGSIKSLIKFNNADYMVAQRYFLPSKKDLNHYHAATIIYCIFHNLCACFSQFYMCENVLLKKLRRIESWVGKMLWSLISLNRFNLIINISLWNYFLYLFEEMGWKLFSYSRMVFVYSTRGNWNFSLRTSNTFTKKSHKIMLVSSI